MLITDTRCTQAKPWLKSKALYNVFELQGGGSIGGCGGDRHFI